ncbi:DUF6449 domain-containing protein [Mesobacillus jeotgali]|uniref:DUF6449 domain-containing protein n=1 Tax=Mesobacillus jeotgali TaxID=129985 RepID=UPI0009A5E100|nr:DUF6449 domain-containing protein [Mesobacillus jeotgali]
MPSKISLFNKEMLLQVARSIGWISAIYFLVLFFAVPLRIMMVYSGDDYQNFMPVKRLFEFEFGIQFIMFITVPVVLAIFLFRFLHVKQAADLMHSLPLKREHIFNFYTMTGFIFLVIPVLITALITIIVHSVYGLNFYFQLEDILRWTGIVILYNAVFFLSGVFVAMVTGISVVQGVLTYIMLLFPAGFTLLINYNLGIMLYGFPNDYYQIRNIEYLSPISHLALMEGRSISAKAVILYLVIVFVAYLLSLFIYKKRNIETASEAIAFNWLRIVFKYGVAFCMSLLGAMYFDAMQNKFAWLIFGYAAGGTVGYFTAEMVLQKTWRVFRSIKGLVYFAAVLTVLIMITQAFSPFEKRVPALNEIQSVTYANYMYLQSDDPYAPKPLLQQENIENVVDFHKRIIQNEKLNEQEMKAQEFAFFVYQLKSGKKMVRQYTINRHDYEPEMRKIYESIEYKHANELVFKIKTDEVTSIRINKHVLDNPLVIVDKEKITQAMSLLKKEIEQEPFTADYYPVGIWSTIEIKAGTDQYDPVELKLTYSSFIDWLEKNGLLKDAIVTPEDLEYIAVTDESIKYNQFRENPQEELLKRIIDDQNTLKITDRDQLQSAIEKAGYDDWSNEEPYTAIFVYKNQDQKEIRTFSTKHVPGFIKQYFKK